MTSNLLLRDKDNVTLQALLKRHLPEATVWAYGSRVNGNAHDTSDLDLVLRTADLSPIPPTKLSVLIEAIRDSNIPILVEVRDWARLPVTFHRQIERNYAVLREGVPPSDAS